MGEAPGRWGKYYERTRDRAPHSSLLESVALVTHKNSALDLGAGSLRDTRFLLQEGFAHVVAVDSEPLVTQETVAEGEDRLEVVLSTFENFDFPENVFDLVNAQYSLPFTSPDSFAEVFEKTKASLKSGGVIVCQLFGEKDGWSDKADMTFHTLDEVRELLSGMETITLKEEETDGVTSEGHAKHWHVFQITARKP